MARRDRPGASPSSDLGLECLPGSSALEKALPWGPDRALSRGRAGRWYSSQRTPWQPGRQDAPPVKVPGGRAEWCLTPDRLVECPNCALPTPSRSTLVSSPRGGRRGLRGARAGRPDAERAPRPARPWAPRWPVRAPRRAPASLETGGPQSRALRGDPPSSPASSRPDTSPAMKESPAPTVSTTVTNGAGSACCSPVRVTCTTAPSPPRVTTTTAGPSAPHVRSTSSSDSPGQSHSTSSSLSLTTSARAMELSTRRRACSGRPISDGRALGS